MVQYYNIKTCRSSLSHCHGEAWGYTPREIERIRRIVIVNRDHLLRQWHEFFGHRSSR